MGLSYRPEGYDAISSYYGWDPNRYVHADGTAAPEWERDMLRNALLPEPLSYLGQSVKTIRVHRKLLDVFEAVYKQILQAGLYDRVRPFAGAYCFRLKRGSDQISMHSFGAAVDHDVAHNPLGAEPDQCGFGNSEDGRKVVAIFKSVGFTWGGDFSGRKDCQHFQWGSGY